MLRSKAKKEVCIGCTEFADANPPVADSPPKTDVRTTLSSITPTSLLSSAIHSVCFFVCCQSDVAGTKG
jgi:hypothetical protein